MFKYSKIYLITFIISLIFSSNYDTLVLLEFENSSQSKEYNSFSHKLPDMIKDNVLNENKNIIVEYAGKIEPYLGLNNTDSEKKLLLLGKYSVEKKQIEVSLELFDLSSWSKISKDFYFCNIDDQVCFQNELLNYSTNLLPLYFADKKSTNTDNDLNADLSTDLIENPTDNLFLAIDNFAVEADLHFSFESLNKTGSQYGDRYYKNFSNDSKKEVIENSRERNTEKLISYFNKIILNPYDVEINDIKMENNKLNDDIIDLKIPVTYLVKKNLIEDMLTTLPHLSTSHSIGSLVIKFSDKDFILSSQEFSKYSFMKYQVVPVLFLSDEIGRTNYIYVDDFDYVKEFNSNISGKSSSKFYPLFAITPGDNEVQINLDMTSLNIEYQFKVSISELKKYSKVAIKFLHKSEIESIIEKVYAMEEEQEG